MRAANYSRPQGDEFTKGALLFRGNRDSFHIQRLCESPAQSLREYCVTMRKMNKSVFNFWQDLSICYLEMAFRNDKNERIKNPDSYGKKPENVGIQLKCF